eukprot:gene8507-11499_t
MATEDSWIWGNHRGGGGAPLRDVQGNNVTNLKKVLKGTIEVDHSPPASIQKGKMINKSNKFRLYDEEDDDSNDYSYKAGRDRRNISEDNYDDENRDKYSRINTKQNKDLSYNSSPEKKKFMGALSDMNANSNAKQLDVKAKKELEYQNALKLQIEENRRKKDEEKRMQDEIKKREYDDYMRNHFKANGASHRSDPNQRSEEAEGSYGAPKTKRTVKDDHNDNDDHNGRHQNGKKHNNNNPKTRVSFENDDNKFNRNKNKPSNYSDDDQDDVRYKKNNNKSSKKFEYYDDNNNYSNDVDSYDERDRDRGAKVNNNKKKAGSNSKHHHPHNDNSVSVEEYDELSKLCDKLLSKQEEMENEIREQANIIKELQKKANGGNISQNSKGKPPRARETNLNDNNSVVSNRQPRDNLLRSKSVQQPRGRNVEQSKNNRNSAVGSGYESDNKLSNKRPSSSHLVAGGKAAFGHGGAVVGGKKKEIVENKPKINMNAPFAPLPPKSKNDISNLPRVASLATKPTNNNQQNHGNFNERERDNIGLKGGGIANNGNGFAKLQLNVTKNKGPVVVTYDDDETGHSNNKRGNGRGPLDGRSLELKGQSEYISIRDDDGIGGDQLDKLLIQARRAR